MSKSRFLQALMLAGALALGGRCLAGTPPLAENQDPARITSTESLLSGPARLEVRPAGAATTLDWQPGEVWRVEQRDGTSRFLTSGPAREGESTGLPLLPRESRWLEVPAGGEVRVVVEELTLRPLPGVTLGLGRAEEQANTLPDGDRAALEPESAAGRAALAAAGFDKPVLLGEPVIFRDLRLVSLTLHPVLVHAGSVQLVESLRLRLEYGTAPAGEPVGPLAWTAAPAVGGNELRALHSWSGNMERIYDDLVPNHGQFYSQVDESVFPIYLITGSPNYLNDPANMAEFVKWKREKGFDVRIVPFDQIPGGGTSISFGALRDWMHTQWELLRPEYLLLVGDVDGEAACPDSVVQAHTGDYDVSDHFYALQEGEDYFPELFVGRFSVDSISQLFVMAQKPVIHEKSPLVASSDWLTRGLVVSCNYSDTGTPPVSPNETSRWVIDKLRANGFTLTAQDSIFYPPVTDGGGLISSALNQGRGIVSYRGWANSNGWIYPAFDRDDIEALGNVMRMPVVGSFVCQTGAFGQGAGDVVVEDPCFGEKFVRLGSPGDWRGAVAFVGPSDLHTRTQYNNPVCSGFFNAIFDLDITSIGPALLNGKMELYNGYPRERTDRFSSYFYFHIYNVLGDPDLKIWRAIPTSLALESDALLRPGQSVLEVSVNDHQGQPVDGATVTLTAGADGGLLLARGVSRAGHLLLNVDPGLLATGLAAVLTADHIDYMPAQRELSVTPSAAALELTGLSVGEETPDGSLLAGETLSVRLSLRNSGSAALPAGSASLRDPALWESLPDYFSLLDGELAIPALGAGEQVTTSEAFQLRLAADVPNLAPLHLVTDLAAGAYTGVADGRLSAANLALELVSAQWRSGAAQLLTGQLDTLDLVLRNTGAYALPGASLSLLSDDPRVLVVDGPLSLPALALGADAAVAFALEGGAGLFTGQALTVRVQAEEGGRLAELSLPLPVGSILPEDPYGPDAHGYYAIESGDFDVRIRPEYDWVELDPAYGGSGAQRLLLGDDDVTTIVLPFPVTHYGRTTDRLSVCSNGWVALGDTWINDFRNWNLPSSLGPPNLIAAFWDDLKPQRVDGTNDSTYVPVYWRHDAAEGRVVISWSRTWNRYNYLAEGQPKQEFQLILYDQTARPTPTGDSELLVQWKDVTDLDQDNNFATCGMENFGHDIGLQVSYSGYPSPGCVEIASGRGVLFTTRQPLHDSSYRVRILEPQPQQWLRTRQPVLRWDHADFAQILQRTDIEYEVVVSSATAELLRRTVSAAGELDLAALGLSLPENQPLFLDLTAQVDTTHYVSLQGRLSFAVDATAPALSAALLASNLFPGHLELGLLSSEALASLRAVVLGGAGQELLELEPDPGSTGISGGRELRYLRAQLAEGASVLRLEAVDLHGLDVLEELPLAAVPFLAGRLDLPAAELGLEWSGGSGWAVALGVRTADDARLLELPGGLHALELRLPAGVDFAELTLPAPEGTVLAARLDGQWRALEQERTGAGLRARLEQDARVGLMRAGSVEGPLPGTFRLTGNYPNPFNPETWIRFELPQEGEPQLVIYNLAGAQVCRLAVGRLQAGSHQVRWDGHDAAGAPVASGLYLARLEFDGQAQTQRMLLVR
ncbi:MAG: C25 family cysteine peptidase [Candidatus Delongbacteria bacterium]